MEKPIKEGPHISDQIFYVEAGLSLHNEDQRFCILACSSCKKLFPRHFSQRVFYCTTCHQTPRLTPRSQFEVTITDNTGSTTTIISDKTGEELLSLTPEEIYDIRCAKKQRLPLTNVRNKLMGITFNIQMKRSFVRNQDTVPGKLFILSLRDKERINNPPLSTTGMDSYRKQQTQASPTCHEGRNHIQERQYFRSEIEHAIEVPEKGLKGIEILSFVGWSPLLFLSAVSQHELKYHRNTFLI
ncbi:uncharacterized protein LOC132034123 [Lycium ferocissimum]|uniref:uncharacterized protein LOC132034123 n=1 Tax=Lycium ferocissimum TaxID=112874 RepID=UPI00281520D8|nr:uncharacterized protein LOC132034123 [Lycium ferocissimum]